MLSGWQATTTGDIYTLDETGRGYVLVAGATPALLKGVRVEFTRAVDLYPTDFIEERERGIISHVDAETGTVSVLLEGVHNGLGDNTLTLTPHQDEEAVAALERFKPRTMRCSGHAPESFRAVLCGLATLLVTTPVTVLVHHFIPQRQPAILFMCAVAWVSIALGQRAALVLAAVTPFVYNLFIVPPAFSFTPIGPWEWVVTACYFGVAMTFPWAVSNGKELVHRALGLCHGR